MVWNFTGFAGSKGTFFHTYRLDRTTLLGVLCLSDLSYVEYIERLFSGPATSAPCPQGVLDQCCLFSWEGHEDRIRPVNMGSVFSYRYQWVREIEHPYDCQPSSMEMSCNRFADFMYFQKHR